jgi:hypothetical protein
VRRVRLAAGALGSGNRQTIVAPPLGTPPVVAEPCPECPECPPGVCDWGDFAPRITATVSGDSALIDYDADTGIFTIFAVESGGTGNAVITISTDRTIPTMCRLVGVSPDPFPADLFQYISAEAYIDGLGYYDTVSRLIVFDTPITMTFLALANEFRLNYALITTPSDEIQFRLEYLNSPS